jgi:hypothetical protein
LQLGIKLRHDVALGIELYMLDCLAKVWRQIGQKSGPLLLDRQHLAGFVSLYIAFRVDFGGLMRLEEVPDIGLEDRP